MVESPLRRRAAADDGRQAVRGGDSATALIWKLFLVTEGHFRRLNAPDLLPLVYAGVQFVDGVQKSVTPKEAAA